jgi:hypothetical protein
LVAKIYGLCDRPDAQKLLGNNLHKYCKAVHDEKPVVDKFMHILGEKQ